MSAADYTNDRWHVDGLTVTHEDMPGMAWNLALKDNANVDASRPPNSAWTHASRAWLAAQPKPTIKVGMRIEATLRGGAVVTGEVTSVIECVNLTMVHIGPGVTCYADVTRHEAASDITKWHEATS